MRKNSQLSAIVCLSDRGKLPIITYTALEHQCGEEDIMRLILRKDGKAVKEFRFPKGPVYIGRHVHSQVFLPDREVSRQHAAIFATREGKWVVEDLESAKVDRLKFVLSNDHLCSDALLSADRV